jgi:hypothetical protein
MTENIFLPIPLQKMLHGTIIKLILLKTRGMIHEKENHLYNDSDPCPAGSLCLRQFGRQRSIPRSPDQCGDACPGAHTGSHS